MSQTPPTVPALAERSGDRNERASCSKGAPGRDTRADQTIDGIEPDPTRGREIVPDDYMSPWLARGLDAYEHPGAKMALLPQAYLPRPADRASPLVGDARTLGRAHVATVRRIVRDGHVVGASKDEVSCLDYLMALFAQVGAEPGWHEELFGRSGRGLTIPNRVVIVRVAHHHHIPTELMPLLSPHVDVEDIWAIYRLRPDDMPAASFLAGDALRRCAIESAATGPAGSDDPLPIDQ